MPWSEPDEANIDRHVNRIVRRFGGTVRDVREVLGDLDLEGLSRDEERRVIRQVNDRLRALETGIDDEVAQSVDDVYEHGRARVLVALGLFASIGPAKRYLRSDDSSTSQTHRAFIRREKEVFTDDLLQATQNTSRRVKAAIRDVSAQRLRDGVRARRGVRELSRSIKADMRRRLGDASAFAIRDSAGRRWSLDNYVEMVTRTKLAEAQVEATRNEAIERGALYAVVTTGDACPRCAPYSNAILKITDDAPGDYDTLDDAVQNGLFHPNCRCVVTALREPDNFAR